VSSVSSIPTLTRLRRRLTAWYAATFGIILLLLGTGLYTSIHSQFTRQLKDSLRDATKELIGAAHIREMESRSAHGQVVDAVDELHIPERRLYLLDSVGSPIRPAVVSPWIRDAARRAESTCSRCMRSGFVSPRASCSSPPRWPTRWS
jgi:hypothetical protein